MKRSRVWVADASALVRRWIAEAIAAEPDLELAGVASSGPETLERLTSVAPDVVALGIDLPILDGIEVLKRIRITAPRLQILMVSAVTEHSATATLEALDAGASDFVALPSDGPPEAIRTALRTEVIPKLRALAARRIAPPPSPSEHERMVRIPRVEIVVIGISTGGPPALEHLLPLLPETFPVPVAVVQHMPPMFTRLLAERLDARSPLRVREAIERAPLTPGTIWIAPGGRHLALARSSSGPVLRLDDGPPENSCRPAADVLFRSASELYGAGVLAVVMTGMGHDGLAGCERIYDCGGTVLAQDRATSVVWGMPGTVAEAGLVEELVPLDDMAKAIIGRIEQSR